MSYDTNRPKTVDATQRELDRTADKAHDTVDRVNDKAHSAVDSVSDKTQQFASDAKDTAQHVASKAQDLGAQAVDKAQDLGAQAVDKAQDLGAQAVDRADAATTTIGGKMSDAAQTIRDNAPTSGPVANAAVSAADTLEQAGNYLQTQDLSDIRADLEGIIRRHPVESLLVGLGVGYLLARSMRR
jgi:methyl-accepting chemotaxis protein